MHSQKFIPLCSSCLVRKVYGYDILLLDFVDWLGCS